MEPESDRDIDIQGKSFKLYLKDFLLDSDTWELLCLISRQTEIYVFSGVIRNFLLGYYENRDLDIVIGNTDELNLPLKYFRPLKLKRNSFGGYKVSIGKLIIDVWDIRNTWGIKNLNLQSSPNSLLKTAFFNFSSIVYDFNQEKFIYDNNFIEFYHTHAMDVLCEKNPDIPLCIVNTVYYALKYSFTIKYGLCKWIVDNYCSLYDYKEVQLRHYKYEYFDSVLIEKVVDVCRRALPIMQVSKDSRVLEIWSGRL